MRSIAPVPVITIAICAAVTLSGCANNEKEVSFKSGGVTHVFTEGEAAKAGGFPLPLYPNATPTGKVQTNDDNASFMILSSPDKLEQVSSFYTNKLKVDGWTVNNTATMPQMVNISATKQDVEANVMLGVDNDKTTITLAVSKEPQGTPTPSTETYTPDKLNPPTD
jgi:hypothetical protein